MRKDYPSLHNQTSPGKTILLVEDEKDIAYLVKEVLTEETPPSCLPRSRWKQALALIQTIIHRPLHLKLQPSDDEWS